MEAFKTVYTEFFDNFSSVHTRKSYEIDIRKFVEYLKPRFPEVDNFSLVSREHIIQYRNWLQEVGGRNGTPCAPKTIGRKLAAISSFMDFLVENGVRDFNPVGSIKRPRQDVLTPTNALTKEQVLEIFAAIENNTSSGHLHRALLVMFFTTGLRKSEVLFLKYKDIREINGYRVVEYVGKGGKVGQKVLHELNIEAMDRYLEWMETQGRKHESEDWLFQPTRNPNRPNDLNKPLNPKTINEILDFYSMKIGLGFKISPHSARATFIGELLDAGVDIYSVAREVNHSSVKTTQEYDKRRKKFSDSPVHKLKF